MSVSWQMSLLAMKCPSTHFRLCWPKPRSIKGEKKWPRLMITHLPLCMGGTFCVQQGLTLPPDCLDFPETWLVLGEAEAELNTRSLGYCSSNYTISHSMYLCKHSACVVRNLIETDTNYIFMMSCNPVQSWIKVLSLVWNYWPLFSSFSLMHWDVFL